MSLIQEILLPSPRGTPRSMEVFDWLRAAISAAASSGIVFAALTVADKLAGEYVASIPNATDAAAAVAVVTCLRTLARLYLEGNKHGVEAPVR